MRGFSSLPSFTAILAAGAGAAVVSAQSPTTLPTPQFEPLFAGQLTIAPGGLNTTGPFGVRLHGVVSG